MSLTRDEQRAAYAAPWLSIDALIHDVFPDCHSMGGSSRARGWPDGHGYDWDRKGIEVQGAWPSRSVVARVTWARVRAHGQTIPDVCEQLRAIRSEGRRARLDATRAKNYHRFGDPDAPPWVSHYRIGPIDEPAIEAARVAWREANRIESEALMPLVDAAFPLAWDSEPQDLLELLAIGGAA